MSGQGKVVCVTGASGYIASWLVKILLLRGYTVKATVRDLREPRKVAHLMALEGADERLHLFEANLVEDGSFDSVVDGCEGVFHTASPISLQPTDPQAELMEPAIEGTLNVLRSCRKVPSIRRMVLTSSMTAVLFNNNPRNPDTIVDETWFSDPEYCKEHKLWYPLSKILAEKAAGKFATESGTDLLTMIPGYVIGPLLQPTLNVSCKGILDLIKEGHEIVHGGVYRVVDVRDVVDAHILAFENPSASGRYCLVETGAYSADIMRILKRLFPSFKVPANIKENEFTPPTFKVSKEKAISLGINFTPLELSLKDTVESLIEKNFLSF